MLNTMKKITLINFILCTFLLLGFTTNLSAQLENANWYFGNQAGINFNDGTAPSSLLTDGAMNAPAGCSAISDETGNLLFYTDGETVWNKDHVPMLNGNLIGDSSVSQSVVIAPSPGDANKYYIFSNSAENAVNPGLRYSIVDMTGDFGLGAVDAVEKDILLLTNCSQKMTTVINPFANEYWVVVFGRPSVPSNPGEDVYNSFYSFRVTEMGGVHMPFESNFTPPPPAVDPNNPGPGEFDRNNPIHLAKFAISIPYQKTTNSYAPYEGGQMKISSDYNSLALVHNVNDRGESAQSVYTFSFSAISGEVSSIEAHYLNFLFNFENTYYYGLEFSPDSQQIFVSAFEKGQNGFGSIVRIRNFAQGETPSFNIVSVPVDRDPVFSLQLGIDNKIYATRGDFSFLDVITNPNETDDLLLGYSYGGSPGEGFDLGSKIASQGLPQLTPELFNSKSDAQKAAKPIVKENPFNNELKLKFKYIQTYSIEYYDAMSNLIYTEEYVMQNRRIHKVDTQSWNDGMYFVVIRGDETGDVYYNSAIKTQ